MRAFLDAKKFGLVKAMLNTAPNGRKVGYIRLKQFNANATREMRAAIKDLESQAAEGYVLDLRSNPGGLLEASVDIARQWLTLGMRLFEIVLLPDRLRFCPLLVVRRLCQFPVRAPSEPRGLA